MHNLEILIQSSQKDGIDVVLSGVNENVHRVLEHANVERMIGQRNICDHITRAVTLANSIVAERRSEHQKTE